MTGDRHRRGGLVLLALLVVLALGAGGWLVAHWRHQSPGAGDTVRAATVVDTDRTGSDSGLLFLTFELADGDRHSQQVRTRLFWNPTRGDSIHVFERSAGHWEVVEARSTVRDVGGAAALIAVAVLLTWILVRSLRRRPGSQSGSR